MFYIKSNTKKILFIATIVLTLLAVFVFFAFNTEEKEIIASISETEIYVGDSLEFEDQTDGVKERIWNFGDGTLSTRPSGSHIYKKRGTYRVQLKIDEKLQKEFTVQVLPKRHKVEVKPQIEAVDQAIEFSTVTFKAIAPGAEEFLWEFEDRNKTMLEGERVEFSFQKDGYQKIRLYVDGDTVPVIHEIQILPDTFVDPHEAFERDIRKHLQAIADRRNVNWNYRHMLQKYFCNKNNISVTLNNETKGWSIYDYTHLHLRARSGIIIQDVSVKLNAEQNCATAIEVTEI